MKKILVLFVSFFCMYVLHAQADQVPQQVPNIKLKPGALKAPIPKVLPITIQGTIRELLCEDNEVLVRVQGGQSYRVFPTVAIAGQPIRQHADIMRLCRQHLRFNQAVTVSGERANLNGHDAIARASVTPRG